MVVSFSDPPEGVTGSVTQEVRHRRSAIPAARWGHRGATGQAVRALGELPPRVPCAAAEHTRRGSASPGRTRRALWIGASVVFLLNSACWGAVFNLDGWVR